MHSIFFVYSLRNVCNWFLFAFFFVIDFQRFKMKLVFCHHPIVAIVILAIQTQGIYLKPFELYWRTLFLTRSGLFSVHFNSSSDSDEEISKERTPTIPNVAVTRTLLDEDLRLSSASSDDDF